MLYKKKECSPKNYVQNHSTAAWLTMSLEQQRSVFLFFYFFTQNAAVSSDSFNLKASHHCLTPRGSHTPELGYFEHFLWLIRRPHLPFAAMRALTSGCHPAGAVPPPHWHTWSASGVAKGQANSSRGHCACARACAQCHYCVINRSAAESPH